LVSIDPLEECKKRRKTEVDRYYWTVHLTLGLKDFFDTRNIGCTFVSSEPSFKIIGSDKEVKPDIVLQYNDGAYGILCDIKTSVPEYDFYLRERLKQLELYSNEVEGWDTPNKRVSDHSILLLCHAIDSDLVVEKIREWTKQGKLNISKKLCVVEWSIVGSLKFNGMRDVLLIKHKLGKTGCTILDDWFKKNIKLDVDQLFEKYETCRFVRKEPPVEYMMNELWSTIFPGIHERPEDFNVTIEEILKITHEYFTSWSGLQGEFSQIRPSWITKTMKAFCDIDIAEEIEDKPNTYKIFYGKKIRKDVSDYFVERLCRNTLKDVIKKPLKEAMEEAQRKLAEFDQ
jgi:hypothetical protein